MVEEKRKINQPLKHLDILIINTCKTPNLLFKVESWDFHIWPVTMWTNHNQHDE